MPEQYKKLYRSRTDRIIFGVCGGLAKHFNLDVSLFRVLFVLLTLANGAGVIFYLILALVVPEEPGEGTQADRGEKLKEFAGEVGSKAKELAAEINLDKKRGLDLKNLLGIIIVLIGVVLLLQQVAPFVFRWFNWDFVWPTLVILLGFYLIFIKK